MFCVLRVSITAIADIPNSFATLNIKMVLVYKKKHFSKMKYFKFISLKVTKLSLLETKISELYLIMVGKQNLVFLKRNLHCLNISLLKYFVIIFLIMFDLFILSKFLKIIKHFRFDFTSFLCINNLLIITYLFSTA